MIRFDWLKYILHILYVKKICEEFAPGTIPIISFHDHQNTTDWLP